MADNNEPSAELEELKTALALWRQGDFTISTGEFPVAFLNENNVIEAGWDTVHGLVVVSQTCDIVNAVDLDDVVVVAPIVEVTDGLLEAIKFGTTTVGAVIENAILPTDVADLRYLATIRKSSLVKMERKEGFNSEQTRDVFVNALERRYGRFAFPDALSDGPVITIRNRAKSLRKKNSPKANVYKSLRSIRLAADPDFDTPGAKIQFLLVLNDLPHVFAESKDIIVELESQEQADRFNWPATFEKHSPLFRVVTMDSLSAREWDNSRHVDLDFISWRNEA
ncbi:hypothetical protein N182_38085 [Sinorhizobium sp. GL2]|nr:hypothetical protein N182_38085 [Sinorhizobium sp. GL2]